MQESLTKKRRKKRNVDKNILQKGRENGRQKGLVKYSKQSVHKMIHEKNASPAKIVAFFYELLTPKGRSQRGSKVLEITFNTSQVLLCAPLIPKGLRALVI